MRYPVWFSDLDQRKINLALQQAVATLRHTAGDGDVAAVRAVLQVLDVVAVIVEHHRDRQPVADLVRAADDLRDQVIAEIDRVRTTVQTPLDVFEQIVRAELEQSAWWDQALKELPVEHEPAIPEASTTNERILLTLEEAAGQLHVSVDTVSRMRNLKTVRLGDKIVRVRQSEIDRLLKASEKYHHRRAPSRRKKSRR